MFIGQSLTSLKLAGNPLECVPEVGKWSVSYTLVVDAGIGDCRHDGCSGNSLTIGDSYCSDENNNEECEWDGGDCCKCHCSGYGCREFYKSPTPVTCKNPTAACQDEEFKDDESEEEEDNEAVAASLGEDDDGSMHDVQDVEDGFSAVSPDFVVSASGFYIYAGFVTTALCRFVRIHIQGSTRYTSFEP